MATPTYELIDSTVLGSSASSVTFSSIDQSYRDLIITVSSTTLSGGYRYCQINSDTGNNYPYVVAYGTGSSTGSYTATGNRIYQDWASSASATVALVQWQILDYSATDKHKPILTRASDSGVIDSMFANRWANTSAVTQLDIAVNGSSFAAGTIIQIHGIAG